MKIIRLEAENVKRLSAVEITPEGNIVEITGKNGAGKTSILDSIFYALAGERRIPTRPIRAGEERAVIRLDMGQLKIRRTFNAQEDGGFTTSLVVESEDGARYPKPQEILNGLVGSLTFDPLDFMQKDGKDQLRDLQRLVPGVDFDAIAQSNKADFDNRRDINRQAESTKARAAAITLAEIEEPSAPLDDLLARLTGASDHNAKIATLREQRLSYERDTLALVNLADEKRDRADDLLAQAASLAKEVDELQARVGKRNEAVSNAKPLDDPIDTQALSAEIDKARRFNAVEGSRLAKVGLEEEAAELEAKSRLLTEQMANRERIRTEAIAQAKLPVDGLGLSEDGVTFNGLPLDQASDAEQLRVSIAIAAAMNPKLRIIRVRDGSLLDNDSMALLAQFAATEDLQVWIETVASGRAGVIVIEDGRVALQQAAE
jgi:DNA repair exonuclease SbcCD ATPase subunit